VALLYLLYRAAHFPLAPRNANKPTASKKLPSGSFFISEIPAAIEVAIQNTAPRASGLSAGAASRRIGLCPRFAFRISHLALPRSHAHLAGSNKKAAQGRLLCMSIFINPSGT
jgi:hypothetical protein